MRLVVQKYGGTSVGTPDRIRHVARRILETRRQGCRVVAVVSAMAGTTDELLRLGQAVAPQPTKRELDNLLSTGEQAAAALTAMAVNGLGGTAISLTGAQVGILTDRNHTRARIANISPKQIHERLHESFSDVVSSVRLVYARDYAERVFHDRQLCAYIAQLILDIGIDGTIDDEPPGQWCPRLSFPAWVRQSLTARDRGQCANCGANIVGELQGVIHIDHIVPLVRGGCNDIVNLQILCDTCNRQKSAELWSAKSSIPPYLERALAKRRA